MEWYRGTFTWKHRDAFCISSTFHAYTYAHRVTVNMSTLSVFHFELRVCVCICVPCGFKGIHIWEGRNRAHPSLLLATSGVICHCVCPDWLGTPWQPAQICDAVAGMESQHAAASLSAKGLATGKQGTMPSRLPESFSLFNTSIPCHILIPPPSGSLCENVCILTHWEESSSNYTYS